MHTCTCYIRTIEMHAFIWCTKSTVFVGVFDLKVLKMLLELNGPSCVRDHIMYVCTYRNTYM
jgi:hypothetical protein